MKCVCGKEKMDGIRCKFGASHNVLKPKAEKIVRERLPIKRERLDLFE
jgi:hypothetical protein